MITRENFLKGNFDKRKNMDRLQHPVAVFLRDHSKNAFTVKEIIKKVKMNGDAIRNMLSKLRKDNLVEHKSPFFMWKVNNIRPKPKLKKPLKKKRKARR